jgi:hypothetical protein
MVHHNCALAPHIYHSCFNRSQKRSYENVLHFGQYKRITTHCSHRIWETWARQKPFCRGVASPNEDESGTLQFHSTFSGPMPCALSGLQLFLLLELALTRCACQTTIDYGVP